MNEGFKYKSPKVKGIRYQLALVKLNYMRETPQKLIGTRQITMFRLVA